ncbi:hypothetical protein [Phenylobacterium sp.]|uniref:hypothetical protein n=1 Tax=Phenylobacterium sp. TaxID=1871053 RepID=UPI00286BD7EB|nr:hypothetical protein [Phenylobacterium sp.]
MKPLVLLAASALALASAACAPGVAPTARTTLECPATEGDLTRTSVSADQRTCLYTTRGGNEVSLRLIAAPAGYETVLAPIEAELQTEIAADAAGAGAKTTGDKAEAAPLKVASADAKGPGADAAKAAQEAAEDAGRDAKETDGDDAAGLRIDASRGKGEHAHIDLPGIHINADDNGKADVNVGMIHVNAGENGAVVRIARDVRLRGEAFSRERRGFRATYILAQDNLKDGWTAVGYEAGGPKTGPVTVAVVKVKARDHHDVFDHVKRLVRRNGGV